MGSRSLEDRDYLFLRLYSIDLQTARHSLDVLDGVADPDVRMCVIRDIVVTYGRPFARNFPGRHCVTDVLPSVVPSELEPVHQKLTMLRSKLFAHTDLDAHEPHAAVWDLPSGPTFPMTIRGTCYQDLNEIVPAIRRVVMHVEAAVNAEIERRHATLTRGAV